MSDPPAERPLPSITIIENSGVAKQIHQRADKGDKDDNDHPGCFVPAQNPVAVGQILEEHDGQHPVQNTKQYKP
jgi:hypothetical protein